MLCVNCGHDESNHLDSPLGLFCSYNQVINPIPGMMYMFELVSIQKDISTLKIRVADPIPLPDDSHTTKPSNECPCGVWRQGCTYHKD